MSSSVRVSVVVSVAATDTTAADYPGDKVTLPLATTGRSVRAQASQGTPSVRGGGRDGPGWAVAGRGRRPAVLPRRVSVASAVPVGGSHCGGARKSKGT